MNDSILLSSLTELSTMSIPIQNPSKWQCGAWSEDLDLNVSLVFVNLIMSHIAAATELLRGFGRPISAYRNEYAAS